MFFITVLEYLDFVFSERTPVFKRHVFTRRQRGF